MSAAIADTAVSKIDYRTEPSKYHHWTLSFDGPIAGVRRGRGPKSIRPCGELTSMDFRLE